MSPEPDLGEPFPVRSSKEDHSALKIGFVPFKSHDQREEGPRPIAGPARSSIPSAHAPGCPPARSVQPAALKGLSNSLPWFSNHCLGHQSCAPLPGRHWDLWAEGSAWAVCRCLDFSLGGQSKNPLTWEICGIPSSFFSYSFFSI